MTCILQSKEKGLSIFGTVPSRPLLPFVYLFIYFWHQILNPGPGLANMYHTIESCPRRPPQPFSHYLNYETGRRQIGLLLAEFLQQVYYWQPLIAVKGKKRLSSYRTKSTNCNTAVLEIHSVHLSIRERLSLPVPRGWAIILQAHRSSLIGDSWHLHLFTTKCVGWLQRASQGPWSLFQS